MRGILDSYRWRRRLAWSVVCVAAIGAVTLLIVLLPGNVAKRPDVRPGKPVDVSGSPKEVPVTPAQRRAVNRTLVAFIRDGLTRSNPARAWSLVTPGMRAGIGRADWNGGDLPVTPYPARIPRTPEWNILTSTRGDLTVDLVLQPRRGATQGPIAFAVELRRLRGRWLIHSMFPEQTFAPAEPVAAGKRGGARGSGRAAQAPASVPPTTRGRLSPLYFVIPASLLALVVLVPLGVVLVNWRRSRAAERRYREGRL